MYLVTVFVIVIDCQPSVTQFVSNSDAGVNSQSLVPLLTVAWLREDELTVQQKSFLECFHIPNVSKMFERDKSAVLSAMFNYSSHALYDASLCMKITKLSSSLSFNWPSLLSAKCSWVTDCFRLVAGRELADQPTEGWYPVRQQTDAGCRRNYHGRRWRQLIKTTTTTTRRRARVTGWVGLVMGGRSEGGSCPMVDRRTRYRHKNQYDVNAKRASVRQLTDWQTDR